MEKISRMWRSGLCFLLALCMVVGMCPHVAFAEEVTEKETINYVSLGDSMTNGYGLDGYNHNSGVEDYGTNAYPNQFAAELEKRGYAVEHAQLAMSGIRTEDIHWLLELDYDNAEVISAVNAFINENDGEDNWDQAAWNKLFDCGDYWTIDEICNHSRTKATFAHIAGVSYNDGTEEGKKCVEHGALIAEFPSTYNAADGISMGEKVAVIAKYFQEKVAAADVISLSVANGNIGVFGFGRILETIGFSSSDTYLNYNYQDVLRECEPEMKAKLTALVEELKPMLKSKIDNENLVNVGLYIAVSLAMNYAGTLDAILQMNPDVEIVLVPVMNTFGTENAEGAEGTTLGAMMEYVVDPINKFIAGLPTYMQTTNHEVYAAATFYYAEPEYVECIVDTYEEPLTGTVRDRFVESIVGDCNCYYDSNGDKVKEWNCVKHGCFDDKNKNEELDDGESYCGNGYALCRHCDGMVWDMLNGMTVHVTPEEVAVYYAMKEEQKVAYAAANADKAQSIAIYLAFENAIIANKFTAVTLESVLGLGSTELSFDSIMAEYNAAAAEAGKAKYQTVANVLADNDAAKATLIMALLGDNDAIKSLAKSNVSWGNVQHAGIDEILACENEDCCFGCDEARYLYEEMTANPVYGYVAVEADMTAADVKALYEGYVADEASEEKTGVETTENWTNAVHTVIAGKSGGMLKATQVATLAQVGVYEFAAAMLNATLEEGATQYTAAQVKDAYTNKLGLTDAQYAQITGLHQLYNGITAINNGKANIVGGVETANGTVSGVKGLATLLVTPEVLGDVVAESDLKGLLALFGRCVIGNGIGSHPSEVGHNELARAVIAAYGEHTAEDETDDNFEIDPVYKKIVSDLTAQGLLNDDQIIKIAEIAVNQYMTTGGVDLFAAIDEIYNTVFYGQDLTDDQRLEIISIVYTDLKEGNKLTGYGAYLNTLEDIIALPELEVIPAEKTFDLVEYIYAMVKDGDPSIDDIRAIIYYIWTVTLSTADMATFALNDSGVNDEVANKLAIIKAVMDTLATDEGVQASYPQVEAIVELYETLTTADETTGKQLVSDDVLIDLFDDVIGVIGETDDEGNFVVNIENTEEVTAVATEIVTNLVNDKRIPPENKFEIVQVVKDTLISTGDSTGSEEDTENDTIDEVLVVTEAIHAALKEAGYMNDDQFNAIMKELTGVLTGVITGKELSEDEMLVVIENVYQIVFTREDLTLEDKFNIVFIIYSVLEDFGYVDNAYAMGYIMADDEGYVDQAIEYIDIALAAVATAKTAAAEFAVDEEFAEIKAALIAEIDATAATLTAIKDLLVSDALATKDDAFEAIMGLESELNTHIANLKKLALAIGFVADPYIQDAIDAYNGVVALIEKTAAEAYAWVANGIEEFNAEYAELVEEIGQIADKCHPDLGAAVRKYLTETPADTLAILYAHGENAVLVLMAKAALASEDIYNIYNALSLVVEKHGEAIYNAIASYEETGRIFAAIEVAKAELLALYEVANKGSVDTDYEGLINDAQETLGKLYDKLYIEVKGIVIKLTNEDYAELLDAARTELEKLADVAGYAGEYGAWIAEDFELLLEDLLLSLFANNDEFMQVAFPLFVENAEYVRDYLIDLAKDLGEKAWIVYEDVREVIENMIETIREYGENAWEQIQQQLDTLCGIVKDVVAQVKDLLKKINDAAEEIQDKVVDTYNKLIEDLNNELDALIELIKNELKTATGEAKEALENLLEAAQELKAALEELVKGNVYAAIEKIQNAYANLVEALENGAEYLNDAIRAQLQALVESLGENICDLVKGFNDVVKAVLGDTYDKLVDLIWNTIKEQVPAAADWIYNWLYNNPDKVIAWFAEYGDDILDFIADNAVAFAAVIGFIVAEFGEEIAEFVMNNANEILAVMVEWFNVHGENAWELIKVYLEELGVLDAIEDAAQEIKDLLKKINDAAEEIQDKVVDTYNKLIEDLNNELDALINLIKKELATATGEAKEALENLLEAAEELKAALEELVKGTIYAAVEKIQNAYANLVEALENGAEYLNDAIRAQLQTLVESLGENICELVKGFNEVVKDILGDTYDKLVDLIWTTIKEQIPEAADWIYNWLYNNPDKVIAWFTEYGDDILNFIADNAEAFVAVIGFLIVTFGEDIAEFVMNNANEILAVMVEWFNVHGENAWALIRVYLEELGIIDAIEDLHNNLVETLGNLVNGILTNLNALPEEIVDALQAAAEKLLDLVKAELKKFAEEIKPEIEAQIAELQKKLDELKKELEELKAKLENATGELKAEIEAAIAEIEKQIALIEAQIKALMDKLADIPAKLNDLYEAVLALNEAIEKLIADGIDAALEEIQTALDAVADAIEALVAEVSEEVAAELNAIVEEIKAVLNDLYYDATHTEYVVDKDSYYVALGDGTAVSESYVDMLAKELGVKYNNLAQDGMQVNELYALIAEQAAEIEKADLITIGFGSNSFMDYAIDRAVQLQLASHEMAEAPATLDWVAYVGEEGVVEVEEALADIYNDFVAQGLGETTITIEREFAPGIVASVAVEVDVAALMTTAVESYAYAATSYACGLPEAINDIREINADAEIIIVGMYNPVEDVVIDLGATTFEIGEYVDKLVDGANIHNLACAMLNDNVTFVQAEEVESVSESNGVDTAVSAVEFLGMYVNVDIEKLADALFGGELIVDALIAPSGEATKPSETGHKYIQVQIMEALILEEDILLGDVDLDGDVDVFDANLVVSYFYGNVDLTPDQLKRAEVDGNSEIDVFDANLIVSYFYGTIDVFPVE